MTRTVILLDAQKPAASCILHPAGHWQESGEKKQRPVGWILDMKKAALSAASFVIDPLRKGSPIGSIATTSVRTAVPLVFGPARRRDIPFRSTLYFKANTDRKSTRLNSSHIPLSRMPSSA